MFLPRGLSGNLIEGGVDTGPARGAIHPYGGGGGGEAGVIQTANANEYGFRPCGRGGGEVDAAFRAEAAVHLGAGVGGGDIVFQRTREGDGGGRKGGIHSR